MGCGLGLWWRPIQAFVVAAAAVRALSVYFIDGLGALSVVFGDEPPIQRKKVIVSL